MKKRIESKINLNPSDLAKYLIENINMSSADVPDWILELNHGNVDPEIFEDANKFEREDVIEIFDNALTSVWLFMIVETDTGEISMDTNEFEALRRDYIMTVQQRMDTVYDLLNMPLIGIMVKPFFILSLTEEKISFIKKVKRAVRLRFTQLKLVLILCYL